MGTMVYRRSFQVKRRQDCGNYAAQWYECISQSSKGWRSLVYHCFIHKVMPVTFVPGAKTACHITRPDSHAHCPTLLGLKRLWRAMGSWGSANPSYARGQQRCKYDLHGQTPPTESRLSFSLNPAGPAFGNAFLLTVYVPSKILPAQFYASVC